MSSCDSDKCTFNDNEWTPIGGQQVMQSQRQEETPVSVRGRERREKRGERRETSISSHVLGSKQGQIVYSSLAASQCPGNLGAQ